MIQYNINTIGKNIAVQLELEQSEIAKRESQAEIEKRKLEAMAIEQENKNKILTIIKPKNNPFK